MLCSLVNILSCLDDLVDSGYSREIPVFGTVHGQLVTGIIVKPYSSSSLKKSNQLEHRMRSSEKLHQYWIPLLLEKDRLPQTGRVRRRARNHAILLLPSRKSRLFSPRHQRPGVSHLCLTTQIHLPPHESTLCLFSTPRHDAQRVCHQPRMPSTLDSN